MTSATEGTAQSSTMNGLIVSMTSSIESALSNARGNGDFPFTSLRYAA